MLSDGFGPEPTERPRLPVKITDVATLAGVAPMTVSRVINTPDRVSPATAAKVRAAIDRLGYVPNLIAGGLSSRKSRMVAAHGDKISPRVKMKALGGHVHKGRIPDRRWARRDQHELHVAERSLANSMDRHNDMWRSCI